MSQSLQPVSYTHLDVYKRQALRATGVTFSGKSYISSINSISEGDCGPQSGWMYSVNGDYPGVGCTKYTLSDGDSIRWRYTCNMGADIGA